MGCDIHLYKEKFVNGAWVTADEWEAYDYGDDEGDKYSDVPWKLRFTDRNYNLFGLLSKGVRYEHPFAFEQRGVPFAPCKEVAALIELDGEDGHSHSYLYLHELKEMAAFLETATIEISGLKSASDMDALNASIATGQPNWELLYPYCQGTSDRTYVHFEIDVPAKFIVGGGIEKIIAGFDGVDGENHRIVFYFYN
jgi:hypothetical protein